MTLGPRELQQIVYAGWSVLTKTRAGSGFENIALSFYGARVIHQLGLYTRVGYTLVQVVHLCGLFTGEGHIQMQIIRRCGSYTEFENIPLCFQGMWVLHKCGFYSRFENINFSF